MNSFELVDIEFLGRVQKEHKVWLKKNFGTQKDWQPFIGVLEEIGELSHSYLKHSQQVRMNEDHIAKMKDAIGDIVIFMISFCNALDIDFSEIQNNQITFTYDKITDKPHLNILKMVKAYSALSDMFYLSLYSKKERKILTLTYFNIMIIELIKFCSLFDFNINDCFYSAWQEVVKRDWTKERKADN